MKEIELFYLTGCPYCVHAKNAIEELKKENTAFSDISVTWIEEEKEPDRVAGHDYWYVPSIFYNGKKLYEAQPGQDYQTVKANVCRSFEEVLSS